MTKKKTAAAANPDSAIGDALEAVYEEMRRHTELLELIAIAQVRSALILEEEHRYRQNGPGYCPDIAGVGPRLRAAMLRLKETGRIAEERL